MYDTFARKVLLHLRLIFIIPFSLIFYLFFRTTVRIRTSLYEVHTIIHHTDTKLLIVIRTSTIIVQLPITGPYIQLYTWYMYNSLINVFLFGKRETENFLSSGIFCVFDVNICIVILHKIYTYICVKYVEDNYPSYMYVRIYYTRINTYT